MTWGNNPPAEAAPSSGECPSLTIGSLDCRIGRSHLWRARQIIECCLDGGSLKDYEALISAR